MIEAFQVDCEIALMSENMRNDVGKLDTPGLYVQRENDGILYVHPKSYICELFLF